MIGRRLLTAFAVMVIPITLVVPALALRAGATDTAAASPARASTLPPSNRKDLVAIFGPRVRQFGLRVTRAALVDPKNRRDPHGTHLAIYVEPTGAYTPQNYVDGTVTVTRVFLPYVFSRWKGLKSFDVCQEPRPAVDNRAEPPPETQVFASRKGSAAIDWVTVDVATMVERTAIEAAAAGIKRPTAFSLYVAKHLENTPAYQNAVGPTASSTPSPSPTTPAYG
jgi:hypothetical protein